MAIKTRFVMPVQCFQAMRSLGYVGSVDAMFSQFAAKHGITDSILKHKALAEGTTVTEAVRRVLCDRHPELQYVWIPKHTAPKPHQPVKADLSDDRKAVMQACRVIASLLTDPDDGRAKYHAREFLAKHRQH